MSKLDQLKALGAAKMAARSNPVAKATKGKTGTAGSTGPVRRATTGTGLQVGEAVAVQPATSEIMDATGRRDSHSILKRGRPRITEQRPWQVAGMSRTTWYRRQKEQKK